MGTLFALVLTVGMTNGEFQDVVIGIYQTYEQCEADAVERRVSAECFPVERIVRADEVSASALTNQ